MVVCKHCYRKECSCATLRLCSFKVIQECDCWYLYKEILTACSSDEIVTEEPECDSCSTVCIPCKQLTKPDQTVNACVAQGDETLLTYQFDAVNVKNDSFMMFKIIVNNERCKPYTINSILITLYKNGEIVKTNTVSENVKLAPWDDLNFMFTMAFADDGGDYTVSVLVKSNDGELKEKLYIEKDVRDKYCPSTIVEFYDPPFDPITLYSSSKFCLEEIVECEDACNVALLRNPTTKATINTSNKTLYKPKCVTPCLKVCAVSKECDTVFCLCADITTVDQYHVYNLYATPGDNKTCTTTVTFDFTLECISYTKEYHYDIYFDNSIVKSGSFKLTTANSSFRNVLTLMAEVCKVKVVVKWTNDLFNLKTGTVVKGTTVEQKEVITNVIISPSIKGNVMSNIIKGSWVNPKTIPINPFVVNNTLYNNVPNFDIIYKLVNGGVDVKNMNNDFRFVVMGDEIEIESKSQSSYSENIINHKI